jgi:RND family efflux transporter MFP subunit
VSSYNMFQQSNLSSFTNKLVLLAVFIAAAIIIMLYARPLISSEVLQINKLSVETLELNVQPSYQIGKRFVGQVNPVQQVNIASELPGKILNVNVDEGDSVKQGQLLVSLDTQILESEKQQLEATLRVFLAQLDLAKRRLARQKQLQSKSYTDEDTLDAIITQISSLTAQVNASEKTIENVAIRIEKSFIKSPFDGAVSERYIDRGSVVNAGTPILKIITSSELEINVGISSELTENIMLNKFYEFKQQNQTLKALLVAKSPNINPLTQTRQVKFKPIISNTKSMLRAGDYVSLIIELSNSTPGYWIPITALLEGERGLWNVYLVNESNKVTKHAVEIIHATNEQAYIQASLGNKAILIKSGLNRLVNGMTVKL